MIFFCEKCDTRAGKLNQPRRINPLVGLQYMTEPKSYKTSILQNIPNLSQFYTSSFDIKKSKKSVTSQLEQLEEAKQTCQLSWPEGSKYKIVDAIAVGGMGAILRAWDNDAQRDVAMKVMLDCDMNSPAAKRFMREAKVVGNLEHPNIVPVHDIGTSAHGEPYFTMKWVKGENLADILYKIRKRVPEYIKNYNLPILLDIFIKVCNGVAFAHSRKIAHLDLKPHNILVGDFGEVLVLDWGLSAVINKGKIGQQYSFVNSIAQINYNNNNTLAYNYERFTEDGTIKGTPGFMAPEQADGKTGEMDQRSDVFSLGSILYVILTLRYPIVGENTSEILWHTISGNFVPPGKRTADQNIPNQLEAIVMKAMALNKHDRYDSVESLQADIQAYLSGYATSIEKANIFKKFILFLRRRKTETSLLAASAVITTSLIAVFMIKLNSQIKETLKEKELSKSILEEALAAKTEALINKELATIKKIEADVANSLADFNAYLANIHFSDLSIKRLQFDVAKKSLDKCPLHSRHWEWGRLKYLTEMDYLTIPNEISFKAISTSEDGNLIATVNGEWGIIVRDTNTGDTLKFLKREMVENISVAISVDQRYIFSGCNDNVAEIWDLESGKLVRLLSGHSGPVTLIELCTNKPLCLTVCDDGSVTIWNSAIGKKIRTIQAHDSKITSISINDDGNRMITNGIDGIIKIWDCNSGNLLRAIKKITVSSTANSINAEKNLVITGYNDGKIVLWNTNTGRKIQTHDAHQGSIKSISISSDGSHYVTGGNDFLTKVWNINTGILLSTLKGHGAPVNSVKINGNGQIVISVGDDNTTKIWLTGKVNEVRKLSSHNAEILSTAISSDNKIIATGCSDSIVKLWSSESSKEITTLKGHRDAITDLKFYVSGDQIATSSKDKTIRIWKLKTARERLVLRGHTDVVNAITLNRDNRTIISGSNDKTARVWSAIDGRHLNTFSEHTGEVTCVSFNPDGKYVVTGGKDKTVRVWSPDTMKQITLINNLSYPVSAVTFSPDGSIIAVGDIKGYIIIYSISGGIIKKIKGHWGKINDLCFSSDQKRLISGSTDTSTKIWDVQTVAELITLKEHSKSVNSITISPDSRKIISAGSDKLAIIWDTIKWSN